MNRRLQPRHASSSSGPIAVRLHFALLRCGREEGSILDSCPVRLPRSHNSDARRHSIFRRAAGLMQLAAARPSNFCCRPGTLLTLCMPRSAAVSHRVWCWCLHQPPSTLAFPSTSPWSSTPRSSSTSPSNFDQPGCEFCTLARAQCVKRLSAINALPLPRFEQPSNLIRTRASSTEALPNNLGKFGRTLGEIAL